MASSKASIREIFTKQIAAVEQYANNEGRALSGQGRPYFFYPDKQGWDGNLFDLAGMSMPFSRATLGEDFVKVVSNPEDSGVTGDLAVIQIQGDFLAAMERAFRARHQTSIRNQAHAAARRQGHGTSGIGALSQGLRGYVEHLDKMSKSERAS